MSARFKQILELKEKYDKLRTSKISLLEKIDKKELAEQIYNSNAIENSSLSLDETSKILSNQPLEREIIDRELYEAQNLSKVITYLSDKKDQKIDSDLILLLHQSLIGGIDDRIAGRYRKYGEFVRVGYHIAPAPEVVTMLLTEALRAYNEDTEYNFVEKIALFHLEFERIHPFCDGNGRIGRVLINQQLANLDLPPVIIRNDTKHIDYYPVFNPYHRTKDFDDATKMIELLELSLMESLHKRLAYLESKEVIELTQFAEEEKSSITDLQNKARSQTIPAFREEEVWQIAR